MVVKLSAKILYTYTYTYTNISLALNFYGPRMSHFTILNIKQALPALMGEGTDFFAGGDGYVGAVVVDAFHGTDDRSRARREHFQ